MNADMRHTPECNMTMADGGGCECGESGILGRRRATTPALEPPLPCAEFHDPARTIEFMLAGDAYVTFQSRKTGTRFTYRVESAHGDGAFRLSRATHFVSVLVGPDNGRNYKYLGTIFDRRTYGHGKKSKIDQLAFSAVAFAWVWRKLTRDEMHPELGVWHEGRCGRCGRRLTTPESVASGLGPTCRGRAAGRGA